MNYLAVLIIVCSVPAGLGAAVDRLLLNRHKGRLHEILLRYWLHLEDLSIPDIWQVFATYTIRFFMRIFGKRIRSFRFIVTLILISFCLTLSAMSLGLVLDEVLDVSDFDAWDWIDALFINLVFDTLTGLVTLKVLSVVPRSTPVKAIALVFIDVTIAFLLAIACVTIVSAPEGVLGLVNAICYSWKSLFAGRVPDLTLLGYLYAGTAFIPTLLYLTVLATLVISKAVLETGIRVSKYLLEGAAEVQKSEDLAVFTRTGSLFSIIVLLLTTLTKLWQFFISS